MYNIGRRVRTRRKQLRIKQSELAHRIGVYPSTLCRIENGQQLCDVETIIKIAEILSVNPFELIEVEYDFGQSTIEELSVLYKSRKYTDMLSVIRHAKGSDYFREPCNHYRLKLWKSMALFRLKRYDESMGICERLMGVANDGIHRVMIFIIAGGNQLALSNAKLALQFFERAQGIMNVSNQIVRPHEVQKYIDYSLGLVHKTMDNRDKAIRHLKRSYAMLESDIGYQMDHLADVQFQLAEIAIKQGEWESAIQYARESLRSYEYIGNVVRQVRLHRTLTRIYEQLSNQERAAYHREQFESICRTHPNVEWESD